ncbi:MAG TPA: hypothetical protein VJ822_17050 [Dongiaceae bacterium]|nr:hypothetical protein [Dongiaceae bacterium]
MSHIAHQKDQAGRPADAPADADNNLARGAPGDREERIQQKRRNEARSVQRDPQYRNRQVHDLDREKGAIDEKPGVRTPRQRGKP